MSTSTTTTAVKVPNKVMKAAKALVRADILAQRAGKTLDKGAYRELENLATKATKTDLGAMSLALLATLKAQSVFEKKGLAGLSN